jgi:hypothetical protein
MLIADSSEGVRQAKQVIPLEERIAHRRAYRNRIVMQANALRRGLPRSAHVL